MILVFLSLKKNIDKQTVYQVWENEITCVVWRTLAGKENLNRIRERIDTVQGEWN